MRRTLSALVAAVVALVLAQPVAALPAPVRIMPLGDSITAGPGCWRALLWDCLQHTGYTNIDFVGTQVGGAAPPRSSPRTPSWAAGKSTSTPSTACTRPTPASRRCPTGGTPR